MPYGAAEQLRRSSMVSGPAKLAPVYKPKRISIFRDISTSLREICVAWAQSSASEFSRSRRGVLEYCGNRIFSGEIAHGSRGPFRTFVNSILNGALASNCEATMRPLWRTRTIMLPRNVRNLWGARTGKGAPSCFFCVHPLADFLVAAREIS